MGQPGSKTLGPRTVPQELGGNYGRWRPMIPRKRFCKRYGGSMPPWRPGSCVIAESKNPLGRQSQPDHRGQQGSRRQRGSIRRRGLGSGHDRHGVRTEAPPAFWLRLQPQIDEAAGVRHRSQLLISRERSTNKKTTRRRSAFGAAFSWLKSEPSGGSTAEKSG